MNKFDGHEVKLGDTVFDLLYGVGSVIEFLPDGRFRVAFTTRASAVSYDENGFQPKYPRRTLYWKDPVICVPEKNEARWEISRSAAKAVIESIRRS